MIVQRTAQEQLKKGLINNKVVVVRGPRQSGKFTLVNSVFPEEHPEVLYIDCTIKTQREHCTDLAEFKKILAQKTVLVIRNAQSLPSVNEVMDWCFEIDQLENVVLICSYEPDLDDAFWEVFRSSGAEIVLSPLSYEECAAHFGLGSEDKRIEERLLFGYYPQVVVSENKEEELLQCLEKAIIRHFNVSERINKKEELLKLLRRLAFQIGEVISYNELGQHCGLDNETVERYILLFEKAGILFKLSSHFTTHKYELKKSFMVYFCDNGIRNALIRSFQPMEYRNDAEQLWKNWVLSERRKQLLASGKDMQLCFWLTHTKQRIDYLEIGEQESSGYQISWLKTAKVKIPKSFTETYPQIKVGTVGRSTFMGFLKKKTN